MNTIKSLFISWIALLLLASPMLYAQDTIRFKSKDKLNITADTYLKHDKKHPLIVLFHQAGWSRGEYLEIAPKLNELGFNVLAVDLRSGNKVNGVINHTALAARQAHKGVTYLDARQDIEAALLYAHKLVEKNTKVIAWGSSYSAALVLQVVGEQPKLADAILSFSPGEYFKRSGKPAHWVQQSAHAIYAPVFITSARNEKNRWSAIFKAIESQQKVAFVPSSKGHHGSRALWRKYADSKAYWKAVQDFLEKLKNKPDA